MICNLILRFCTTHRSALVMAVLLLATGWLTPAHAQCFLPATAFAVNSSPQAVVMADVNADNKPDIITTSYANSTVSVLLGTGSGSFGKPTTFAVGSAPTKVAVADVNGDNKPDIITANLGDNNVSVLLGIGNGSFGTQTTFNADSGPNSVTVADVNSDNIPDIITANSFAHNVSVLLGTGNGNFASQINFDVARLGSPVSVAVADVDGDNNPDIITANNTQQNVSVLLGVGGGYFATQTTFAVGDSPNAVQVADVNADKKLDIITANSGSNTVSVLLGMGDGSFGTQTTFAVDNTPSSVTMDYVNADNKLDIVTANSNSNTVSVLLGTGSGSFGTQATFTVGNSPISVAVADVNADSKPDIITANQNGNTISVLLYGLAISITPTPSQTITSGNSVTLTVSGATSYTWSNGSTTNPLVLTNVTSATVLSVTGTTADCSATASVAVSLMANPCEGITNNRLYVKPGGTGNGASWATATGDLQAAIDNTCGATDIWIAQGTYKPAAYPTGCTNCSSVRDYAFMLKDGIRLYGGFAGTETSLSDRTTGHTTTLSGDIDNNNTLDDGNTYHVLLAVNDVTGTLLDGLTITGGYANDNTTRTVEGLIIYQNEGGGIQTQSAALTLVNCSVIANQATKTGGGVAILDRCTSCVYQVTDCLFKQNQSTGNYGGGLYIFTGNGSQLTVSRTVFESNTATVGGGFHCDGGTLNYLNNCLFYNNIATNPNDDGGGAIGAYSSLDITNSTFYGNQSLSTYKKGGAIASYNPINLTNSILWGNTAAAGGNQQLDAGTPANVTYTIIEHNDVTGAGNSSSDPLLINTTNPIGADGQWRTADDGLRLQACSPAIDAGTSTTLTTDISKASRLVGSKTDLGAYEYAGAAGSITVAISANPSLTITSGQSASLTASGATSYTWNTGQTTASISATAAGTYSVTGTTGSCSNTATATVSLSVASGPILYVGPISTVTIGPGNCPGVVSFIGSGLSFTLTGPDYYSAYPVRGGAAVNRTIPFSGIKTTGQYTACAVGNAAQTPVCLTFTVTGQACP